MLPVEFWQQRYETSETPWDLGGPSPHLQAFLVKKPDWFRPGKIAVPGSGRGHDAALFAQVCFDVTGFDYSSGAIEQAKQLYPQVHFEQADIFQLDAPNSPWLAHFDYVIEHTCFCAISPKQRSDYARVMHALLKPKGLLIAVFWEHDAPDGPPFSTTLQNIQTIFEPNFELVSSEDKTPAPGRSGIERLIILRRRA